PPRSTLFPYTTLFRSGDGSDARLWMPGARDPARAGYVAELEALAQSLGVAGAVAITAPTAAIARAYAAANVVLQLSRKPEAFGRDRKSTRLNSSHVKI